MLAMSFALQAYRYGDTNGHQYPLGSAATIEEARKLAQHHAEYRGGKYGVAIYGAANVEDIPEILEYVPSIYGEERPAFDFRHTYESILGGRMLSIAAGWSDMTADEVLQSARHYYSQFESRKKNP